MSPTQIRTNSNTISLKGSNHITSFDLEKVASEKLSNNNTSKSNSSCHMSHTNEHGI